MTKFAVGAIVTVLPNMRSFTANDHKELQWIGTVCMETKYSYVVAPLPHECGIGCGRDVLKERVIARGAP